MKTIKECNKILRQGVEIGKTIERKRVLGLIDELKKAIADMRIKHNNFTEDYKVAFNVATGRALLLAEELKAKIEG